MRSGCVRYFVRRSCYSLQVRNMSLNSKALILGAFASKSNTFSLTASSKAFDSSVEGKLSQLLKSCNFDGKTKKARYFYNLSPKFPVVIVTGLGDESAGYCPNEEINLKSENVRLALAKAGSLCKELEITEANIDDCGCPSVAGEISALINYQVIKWKSKPKSHNCKYTLADLVPNSSSTNSFNAGVCLGDAQSYSAMLAETPANYKTPTILAKEIVESMPKEVECFMRDKEWIKANKMNLFLSVNQGSVEPPILGEYHYKGAEGPPIVLVGKGITFDSGGISIKPSASMADMKADMQGAACVVSTIRAIAKLKLKLHVIGITPFTENLPSGSATKPGDVFVSMSGKTVEVDNTDAEGRLVLADAITYAQTFNPSQIIDLATLTGAVCVALGNATSAIYTKCPQMLSDFKSAAAISGDRVWHMPLFNYYSKMIKSKVADLINCTKKREAGSCTAASFLSEFVTIQKWAHLDIAGVMMGDKESMPYCPNGMSGRPTRTLIEYLIQQEVKNHPKSI